jgi:hypothetical protein
LSSALEKKLRKFWHSWYIAFGLNSSGQVVTESSSLFREVCSFRNKNTYIKKSLKGSFGSENLRDIEDFAFLLFCLKSVTARLEVFESRVFVRSGAE